MNQGNDHAGREQGEKDQGVREEDLPVRDPSLPMHTWEPLSRFSKRVDDYAKYRPQYPAAALVAVLEGMGLGGTPGKLVAADVGAGTGISSRWLAYAGLKVYAIEPNEAMRAAGASVPHERIEWRDGTGEKTGLADRSVDLILCAQAFHWFKANEALAEFGRVLRGRGRLALVWNDRADHDPVTSEYNAILTSFGAQTRYDQSKDAARMLETSSLFSGYEHRVFLNHQDMDLAAAIGRTRSVSTCPSAGPEWEAIRAKIEEWFNRRQTGGRVRLVYDCHVYTATVK